jgi:adenosylcobinamide-GDP ribazoletransferase
MINDIKVAFAFLTRIPIGHKPDISIQRSAVWFPFVGWVIGGVTGILYYFLSQGIPALPAAVITILFSTLVTGGFHQDGLADTFDGLVGGWTPEDRLRILKDSRHGTYGVLSIVLQLIIQISLLSTLSPKIGALAIITAHSLGRHDGTCRAIARRHGCYLFACCPWAKCICFDRADNCLALWINWCTPVYCSSNNCCSRFGFS